MKVPFRLQTSEHDCVPTTALNALSYLYSRSEIPPLAVQRIFMYCLDSVSAQQNHGHGTTHYAVQLFGNWLNQFRTKQFRTSATFLSTEQVHLRKNNPLARTLNRGGVAMLRVKGDGKHVWHYILALSFESDWLLAFDPYPRPRKKAPPDSYAFMADAKGQEPNLRIHREWLDTLSNKEPYHLGTQSEREALLLLRADA